MRRIDHSEILGKTFGRLTVDALAPPPPPRTGRRPSHHYFCTCTCGKTQVLIRRDALLKGTTRSCGCLLRERHIGRRGISPRFNHVSSAQDIRHILRVANDF